MMELTQKSQKQRDTVMDSIFKKALQEFHTELLSYQAALKVSETSSDFYFCQFDAYIELGNR